MYGLLCSQEVRAVERRVLLETLVGQLPPDTIQYSSQLVKIETSPNGDTFLEFLDGSKILAKVSHWLIVIYGVFDIEIYSFNCDFIFTKLSWKNN